jgi:hypothetical protein
LPAKTVCETAGPDRNSQCYSCCAPTGFSGAPVRLQCFSRSGPESRKIPGLRKIERSRRKGRMRGPFFQESTAVRIWDFRKAAGATIAVRVRESDFSMQRSVVRRLTQIGAPESGLSTLRVVPVCERIECVRESPVSSCCMRTWDHALESWFGLRSREVIDPSVGWPT